MNSIDETAKFKYPDTDNLRDVYKRLTDLKCKFDNDNDKNNINNYCESLQGIISKLDNLQSEVNSKVLFVGILGAVKSGKSTLCNAILGSNICEVGESETTFRPIIYYPTDDSNLQDTVELFSGAETKDMSSFMDEVFKYLRDPDSNDCQKLNRHGPYRLKEVKSELNNVSIQGKNDIAAVVVYLENKRLFGEDGKRVSFVDFPGLDGVKANDGGEKYICIANKIDFYLFVYPSSGVLSKGYIEFLNRKEDSKKPKILIFENIIHSKYWMDKFDENEKWRKKNEEQAAILKKSGFKDIESNYANLALLSSNEIKEECKSYLSEDKFNHCVRYNFNCFEKFQDEFLTSLQAKHKSVLRENARNTVSSVLKDFGGVQEQINNWLDSKISDLNKTKKSVDKCEYNKYTFNFKLYNTYIMGLENELIEYIDKAYPRTDSQSELKAILSKYDSSVKNGIANEIDCFEKKLKEELKTELEKINNVENFVFNVNENHFTLGLELTKKMKDHINEAQSKVKSLIWRAKHVLSNWKKTSVAKFKECLNEQIDNLDSSIPAKVLEDRIEIFDSSVKADFYTAKSEKLKELESEIESFESIKRCLGERYNLLFKYERSINDEIYAKANIHESELSNGV